MKLLQAAALLLAGVSPAAHSAVSQAAPAPLAANSQVETRYAAPTNPAYQHIYDGLKRRQVLEELQQFLSPLRLPRKLTVQLDQCGATSRLRHQSNNIVCASTLLRNEMLAISLMYHLSS